MINKDLRDFGRGFTRIRETLGDDSQDFGRGFARIRARLLEGICKDLQDFVKLWERIHKEL